MTTNETPEVSLRRSPPLTFRQRIATTERGQQYDIGKERSGTVAAAFNAITGKDLTPAEVYLVLQITRDVRHHDARVSPG